MNIHHTFSKLPKLVFPRKNESRTEHCTSLEPGKTDYTFLRRETQQLESLSCFKIRHKGMGEQFLSVGFRSPHSETMCYAGSECSGIKPAEVCEVNSIAPKRNIYHFFSYKWKNLPAMASIQKNM